ncbi:MBOAT family protein, partial [Clostridium botulinum]|nr:MBOAT family protein [Clostridium botulinum]
MIFNSQQFILVFLPISILIYFFVDKIDKSDKRLLKKIFLICISLFFYGYTNKKYIVIILFSIIINFTIGKLIIKFNKLKSAKKMLLIIGLVFN